MARLSEAEAAEEILKIISGTGNVQRYKKIDVIKTMIEIHGSQVNSTLCEAAIINLMNTNQCVQVYKGGWHLELPHREGAAND